MRGKRVNKGRHRAKKDMVMLGICFFALIGGVFIIRGFAAKQVNTLEPGVIFGESILVKSATPTVSYELDVKNGLNYCFRTKASGEISELWVYSGGDITARLQVNSSKPEVCYAPNNKMTETIEIVADGPNLVIEEVIIRAL